MAEADAPAQVVVRWCGTEYATNVTPGDTIGDLKRKFKELPAKRQRFKLDMYENDLADQVLLSSLPNTIDVYGLTQRDEGSYEKIFRGHERDLMCHVTDKRQKLVDYDDTKVGMSKGTYEVVTPEMDCLLKTADKKTPLDRTSFQLMRHFRHPNSVSVENIYISGKDLRLVLSDSIDGTLDCYIKKNGSAAVFDWNAKTLTPFFSKLIIDLCGLLDKLVAEGVYPQSLTLDNLYLKKVNGKLQLKVLFNHVEPMAKEDCDRKMQLQKLCRKIKAIMCACVPPGDVMNTATKCFSEFLGNEAANFFGCNLMLVAQSYPFMWTDERKGAYLIDVMSSNIDLRPINNCGIKWSGDMLQELEEIENMVKDDNERQLKRKRYLQSIGKTEEANKIKPREWNYDTKFPKDIVRMIRNFWKHYNTLPWKLRAHLGSRVGALRTLERWCSEIWFRIYNAVGLA